jgi:hypothetical protein
LPKSTPKPCSIEGCPRPSRKRGWCETHYTRWKRHGSPLIAHYHHAPKGEPERVLREAIATRDRTTGCWEWPYHLSEDGYGRIASVEGTVRVGHAALILDGNPRPEPPNNQALHSCDNPPCFNPTHLRWGTHQNNMADMVERQRHFGCPGEKNGRAKLTVEQVRHIYLDPRRTGTIARSYGLSWSAVDRIKSGLSWRCLKFEPVEQTLVPSPHPDPIRRAAR